MADIDGDDPKEYRWETGYEKTWEALTEDNDGLLDSAIADIIQKAKRKRQAEKGQKNRLGMMRHLYVVIDCSEAMAVPDLKPTRMICSLKLLEMFIEEFFGQNPIGQLGLIALKKKRAEKLTELTGTGKLHIKALEGMRDIMPSGEPSLQNGLDLAIKTLKVVPSHASREVLIVMGSLTTCDPEDINTTIETLKQEGIRVSVISLSAEIHICRRLTQLTQGTYSSVLDDAHFKDQLMAHVDPPSASQTQENSLIKMGFPHADEDDGKEPLLSICMCHIENPDDPSKLSDGGYHCPQCESKYCELPVECQTCGLMLVSAPHLARSYHHLFPVPRFIELENKGETPNCFACKKSLESLTLEKNVFRCENCLEIFCVDCDIFIHDTLHTCTGCNSRLGTSNQMFTRKPQGITASASTKFVKQ